MTTLERLQPMDDDSILYVALVADEDVLSFVSSDRSAGCDENQLADRHGSNHRRQRMDASRPDNDWLDDMRVKCGGDVGRHPAHERDPQAEKIQAQTG
ncbi:MAG: hypothetical protein ACXWWJ_07170 [Nitrospira sp.]